MPTRQGFTCNRSSFTGEDKNHLYCDEKRYNKEMEFY